MKRRIVVVEDEPGISLPIRDELASEGFAVELAEDGVAGLAAILREEPDLVVLDLMLPGLGGLDVCKELRRRRVEVPVIMLSARGQEIDRVVGLEIGADDYMTKPFSLRELVARIRVRLRRSERGSDALLHYRLDEQLGAGGMGVVYKARDLRLERWVALKFLSSGLALDPAARDRFYREARAASCLDHPNIATIYGIDESHSGRLFIAMAYYEGETLKQKLEAGPLPLDAAVDLARQAAAGLAHAHERGLVHRDVKPSNLLVTREGVLKIVDFGIATVVEPDATMTRPIWGTPAYVAPEQARGEPADARADVFSLGRVLVEMVTGRLPALEQQHGFTADPRLERVFARALALDPACRYATAAEMLLDLTAC